MPTLADGTITRERIVGEALELIAANGFNGFSYRDLEARIGIRAASIHHHFPAKGDLGVAVIEAYRQAMRTRWAEARQAASSPGGWIRHMLAYLRDQAHSDALHACPIGALQAEFAGLPPAMHAAIRDLCEEVVVHYAQWCEEGRRCGDLVFPGPARAMAELYACAVQSLLQRRRANPDESPDAVIDQMHRLLGLEPDRLPTKSQVAL